MRHIQNLNTIVILTFFGIFFSRPVFAEDVYSVDEQIRILEDKDYVQHLKQLKKEKALQEKARRQQALARKKEKKAYEKARKKQIQQRQQNRPQSADEFDQVYQAKMKKEKAKQAKELRQHISQRKLERKKQQKQQAINKKNFYRSNPMSRQASPRVDRSKRKFF